MSTCAASTLLSPNLRSTPGHLAEKDVLSAESSMLTPPGPEDTTHLSINSLLIFV